MFREQEQWHIWFIQNLDSKTTAPVVGMLKRTIEKKSWKAARGLIDKKQCRVCYKQSETVKHLVAA